MGAYAFNEDLTKYDLKKRIEIIQTFAATLNSTSGITKDIDVDSLLSSALSGYDNDEVFGIAFHEIWRESPPTQNTPSPTVDNLALNWGFFTKKNIFDIKSGTTLHPKSLEISSKIQYVKTSSSSVYYSDTYARFYKFTNTTPNKIYLRIGVNQASDLPSSQDCNVCISIFRLLG